MSETPTLTRGPVWRAIATVSGPMVLGVLAVLSVGVADAFFLARHSAEGLAAVGYIYPVTVAITSLAIGLSAGANTVLSQAIGAEEDGGAVARLAFHALGLSLVVAVLVALAVWTVGPTLFALIGARGPTLDAVLGYMGWWCLSYPPLVAVMIANAMVRARGDGATSASFMIFAAVVNVALNPVFIFGLGGLPELGTEGAGLATFVARAAATVLALVVVWRRGILVLCAAPFRGLGASARRIARIGAPASASNAINPAGLAAVTAVVATVGDDAVAGFGAATRVQSLLIVPLLALSSGIGPVVGQNWGARTRDRARTATHLSFAFCTVYGLVIGILMALFAGPVATLMTSGGPAAEHAALYLRIVGWSLLGYGIVVVGNAAMNAVDRAVWSMALSAARIGLVYVPLAWALGLAFGYPGIVASAAAANVAGAVGGVLAVRHVGLSDLWRARAAQQPAQ